MGRIYLSVTSTFIGRFCNTRYSNHGITIVEDKIYVLVHQPKRIKVYENQIGFRFIRDIELNGTNWPNDIIYSNKSRNVYISDYEKSCIWVMTTTTGEHRLTKWLDNVTEPNTLSLTREGHLLILRQGDLVNHLEIYTLNATLIRRLQLSKKIRDPRHVVQTSNGNFIISHKLNSLSPLSWVISQLTNDARIIKSVIPRNESERLSYPGHLTLDTDSDRLFVADYYNYRVIMFDSTDLSWRQVVVSKEKNGIEFPHRLVYDASKRHLFVAQHANVSVYEIN